MSYKGEERYGTSIGGCCSSCASIFIAIYMFVIMMDYNLTNNYNADVEILYNRAINPPTYDLTPNDFIPAFQVFDYNGKNYTVNNPDGIVTWYY